MSKVVIIGASGHGKVIADIVRASGDEVLGFLDDDTSKDTMGVVSDYSKFDVEFIVAIGDSQIRERISNELKCRWHTAIHPSAIVSPTAKIEEGTVVMPNAVVNADAKIGKHCIINTGAIIEHDNKIGDFSHISVGTNLGGTVKLGKHTWVGIGSSIKNNISICDNCIIGAGAVVVKNIRDEGTYIGVPARKLIK